MTDGEKGDGSFLFVVHLDLIRSMLHLFSKSYENGISVYKYDQRVPICSSGSRCDATSRNKVDDNLLKS